MNKDIDYATLSDWIVCELRDGRRFLAGKVIDDPNEPDREGEHITTSLVVSPEATISDGNLIETQDNRYLLVDRYRADDALFAKLDAWTSARSSPPTLGDVLATRDGELFAAFVLRGFREATAEAVWSRRGANELLS